MCLASMSKQSLLRAKKFPILTVRPVFHKQYHNTSVAEQFFVIYFSSISIVSSWKSQIPFNIEHKWLCLSFLSCWRYSWYLKSWEVMFLGRPFLWISVNKHLWYLSAVCQQNPETMLKACYCHIGAWITTIICKTRKYLILPRIVLLVPRNTLATR